jgi:peroxiredoxin
MLSALGSLGACGQRPRAPAYSYTLLDGTRQDSTRWLGHVTLVNFWATTCSICVAEMPQSIALRQQYQPHGFELLAVAMSHDPPARVAHFAESRALPFPVIIDNMGAIARAFGDVRVTPTWFLIDRQGRIAREWAGAPDMAALRPRIEGLLAEG